MSPRRILPGALALASALAIGLAGIAQASTSSSHHRRHHHHPTHHRTHHSSIPQHNGGDHDADNRGGPSDGDGNI